MGINDIPLKSAQARKLAERDAEVLNNASPPGFRFERTQLRFQVALRNGLSQREAERLEQLAQPLSRTAQWLRSLRRASTSARTGWAIGALAAASAALVVWTATPEPSDVARSSATTRQLLAGVQATRHDFADGSSILLSPGARGRLEQQGQSVHFDLEHGLALFDVTHVPDRATNPERAWRVTAGDYEVTVIGTTFSVRFDAVAGFEVEVQRGAVAVRFPDQDAALQVNTGELLTATRDAVTLRHPDWRGTMAEAQPGREGSRTATSARSAAHAGDESAVGSDTSAASTEAAGLVVARSKPGASRAARQPAATSEGAVAGTTAHSQRSLAANSLPQEREELALLSRARQALAAGQPSRALHWIDVHGRRFAKGQLSEEREALRVEALRHVGRDEDARRAAGEFKKRFPKSVLTKQMPADAP